VDRKYCKCKECKKEMIDGVLGLIEGEAEQLIFCGIEGLVLVLH